MNNCPRCGGALIPQAAPPVGTKRLQCQGCRAVFDGQGRQLLTGAAAPPAPSILEG